MIATLFPTVRIRPQWLAAWRQKENRAFLIGCRISNILSILAYASHLFFIDSIYKLEPRGQWVALRLAAIIANVLCMALTYWPTISTSVWNRLPLIIAGLVCTAVQTISIRWFAATPYMYTIVIPAIAAITLRVSITSSCLFMIACYLVALSTWLQSPELANIISAASVGLVCVGALRGRLSADVDAYISEQESLETQKKLIEAEIELNEQIRAFLPREIFTRFHQLVKTRVLSPPEAMEEVLRCRRAPVTCLHTDIRGFTQSTKTISNFIENSAVPNIRTCTDIVEKFSGIPKLIGDLVFAYFDRGSEFGFIQALICSFELTAKNRVLNELLPDEQRVRRYVLLSYGEALVGNIGGTGGSRDINVLGNPANILSRLDPLTKDSKLRAIIGEDKIVLTANAADHLRRLLPEIESQRIDIHKLSLKMRDFEEQDSITVVPCTEKNLRLLEKELGRQEMMFAQDRPDLNSHYLNRQTRFVA